MLPFLLICCAFGIKRVELVFLRFLCYRKRIHYYYYYYYYYSRVSANDCERVVSFKIQRHIISLIISVFLVIISVVAAVGVVVVIITSSSKSTVVVVVVVVVIVISNCRFICLCYNQNAVPPLFTGR